MPAKSVQNIHHELLRLLILGFPFVTKNSHQDQIDIAPITPNVRSLATLLHKSTSTIRAYAAHIGLIHSKPDFM
jgi:hypothetical protein